jgi:hypothetical protein
VVAPGPTGPLAKKEKGQFTDAEELDHSLRKWAARGGLVGVAVFYIAGLLAVALVLGICPNYPAVSADKWHIVVSVLVALFSVPTVILLAVLRSASLIRKDEASDSLHEAIGQKVMSVLDKVIEGVISK